MGTVTQKTIKTMAIPHSNEWSLQKMMSAIRNGTKHNGRNKNGFLVSRAYFDAVLRNRFVSIA